MTASLTALPARWTSDGRLALVPAGVLVAVIAARDALGIQADPLRIIATFLGATGVLALAVKYPAAFIAPFLFLPRLKEVSVLNGFGEAANWTALQLAGALLVSGILFRWLSPSDESIDGSATLQGHPSAHFALSLFRGADSGRAFRAFLLFAALISISFLYTPAPNYGGEKLTGFVTVGMGMFFASSLLFVSERDYRDFTIGTVLFGLAVAASSLSFSATGANGAEDNPAHIGKGQVIGLAILLLLYARITNRRIRLTVLLAGIPILAIGLVSAETRGPLFSLAFVLLLSFFVQRMRSPLVSRKQMAIVAAALVCAVILLSTFWFYGAEASKFQYKADETIALLQGSGQARGTAVQRLVFYRAAVPNAWFEHPLVGWGIGGWSMAYWHQDNRTYPHNLFLEVLVEQGSAGLAVLLFFLAAIFRQLHRSIAGTTDWGRWLLPCGIYLVSIAMFSGDLDDDRFIWFWCGLTLVSCARTGAAFHAQCQPNEEPEIEGLSINIPHPQQASLASEMHSQ
jgi:O-antigen ligase